MKIEGEFMSEPRLEDMSDYNGLKGKKKRVVWIVIIAGIIVSLVYVAVDNYLGSVKDNLNVKDSVHTVPYK